MTAHDPRTEEAGTTGGPGLPGSVGEGDWLVVPGPLHQHEWRWGRIHEVIGGDRVRYRVRWLGDVHDSVVVPPPGSRVESGAAWPKPGGDAIGVWKG